MMKVRLNSDSKVVAELQEALRLSHGYCPCEIVRTEDTKCQCKAFREQETPGLCHCGLYEKYEID